MEHNQHAIPNIPDRQIPIRLIRPGPSFPNTEIAENNVQNLFDVDTPGQAA